MQDDKKILIEQIVATMYDSKLSNINLNCQGCTV